MVNPQRAATREVYLQSAMDAVSQHHGDMDAYLQGLGFGAECVGVAVLAYAR